MDKLAILIPCYNESVTIAKVINDCRSYLPDAIIYVYDNNSSDNTAEIAANMGAIVRYEKHQGKGAVIRRMFREIDAECYLLIDGDDQHPVEFAQAMCQKILDEQYDMIIGDRLSTTYYTENNRAFHGFGNSFVRFSINKLFKCSVSDVMTGYRAFSYLFVKSFSVISQGFEIETEMTIHAIEKHLLIGSIPVTFRNRPPGSNSTLNTVRDGIKIVKTIFKLFKNYKPLQFFGSVAFILFLLALLFFIPVFIVYIKSSKVPNFPTLIVCGFTMIAALQCLFSGLILTTIKQKNLQDFESRLIDIYTIYRSKR